MAARNRLCRYVLRTTDVAAARAFYAELLGDGFWRATLDVVPLPERARAAGAPSHWAGYIAVEEADFDAKQAAFVAAGSAQLGPMTRDDSGARSAWFQDPMGARVGLYSGVPGAHPPVALRAPGPSQIALSVREGRGTSHDDWNGSSAESPAAERPVTWHFLHTTDPDKALSFYCGLFGWAPKDRVDLGAERGSHRTFAWDAAGEPVGSATDLARLPHVHAQWLYCFPTEDIESRVELVRARGGVVAGISETPSGDRIAGCDDPQGAAFALIQRRW